MNSKKSPLRPPRIVNVKTAVPGPDPSLPGFALQDNTVVFAYWAIAGEFLFARNVTDIFDLQLNEVRNIVSVSDGAMSVEVNDNLLARLPPPPPLAV
ncbi:MAG: hypothetical protein ACP5VQ_11095 [Phycisphaerae bacterium]